jgi:hypothetical protein
MQFARVGGFGILVEILIVSSSGFVFSHAHGVILLALAIHLPCTA